jgi:hypothetical protein
MSLSKSERLQNVDEALRKFLLALGDKGITLRLNPNHEWFLNIHPTTWKHLVDRRLVRPHPTTTSMAYEMTGAGWKEALRIAGHLETPEFKSRLGELLGAFKGRVKGRTSEDFVHPAFAEGAGLSPGWVSNVVDAQLIEHCFRRRGVTWYARLQLIRVPVDVGLELL